MEPGTWNRGTGDRGVRGDDKDRGVNKGDIDSDNNGVSTDVWL